jgi:hypothetical protein
VATYIGKVDDGPIAYSGFLPAVAAGFVYRFIH